MTTTPGPWRVSTYDANDGQEDAIQADDKIGNHVYVVAGYFWNSEDKALIARAPELLDLDPFTPNQWRLIASLLAGLLSDAYLDGVRLYDLADTAGFSDLERQLLQRYQDEVLNGQEL